MSRASDADRAPSDPLLVPGPPAGTGRLLSLLVAAAFVVILNETIMSVALPTLMQEFAVTAATAQWLTTGFMLTMAVVIPFTGWLLTRLPLRAVFVLAMSTFLAGTVMAGLAPVFGVLIAGRVVQAVGTALMMPLLMTTVMNVVPVTRRGATMGVISVVISVAPATGPTVGGVILEHLTWRWMFGTVAPIALAALVAGSVWVRDVTERRRVPLDVVSGLLSAAGFASLVFGLSSIGEAAAGHAPLPPVLPIAAGVVVLSVFAARQLRLGDAALLDLRVLARPGYAVPLGVLLVGMMALFGTLILLPLYLQSVLGWDAQATGLALLPGGLVMASVAYVTGRAYDRVGPRPLVRPGAVLAAAGLWGYALLLGPATTAGLVTALHVTLSAGLGLLFGPLMTTALGALDRPQYPHGSALLSTLQQVAAATGTAVFITVLTVGTAAGLAAGAGQMEATMRGVHTAFLTGAVVHLVSLVGAFRVRRPAPAPETAG
ncbi:DHA2 family efflux MFS transporter permease subunit [Micrococcus flavus]|uniref:DHA2 family lincomycin resistance protein-like MFS transporter n=1 Tax=Micrococcus flavus TaxID=384602 RepID=A0A4Y8X2T9_9MICC|nr:MDR family MFS transporter [Micrococcus flavus]MBB4883608.1 DHA2 family lincomycin resistance protein-like MFS transporter [Micrococcus flavus]TFI02454.1 DHA2 family efflux MFS transporter permease subunit [Micrococcus flavus]GGK53064.1 MFS transporter [Micrococcus flavus]